MGFFDANPLESEGTFVSRLCVQLFIIWLLPRILHTALLEPLLQPRVISEIISGIILGPSCLGQIHNFTNYLFPSRSLPYLQALGSFSVILFLFMTGCHLKPDQMWRQRYKAILSSFTAIGLTLCVAPGLAKLFEDPEYTHFNYTQLILLMAILLSIPAEAVMARILGERGLLGTKLGSLSMGTDSLGLVICFLLLSALLSLYAEDHPCTTPTNLCAGTVYVCPNDSASIMDPLWVFLVFVGFVIFLLTVCRFLFSILAVRAQQKGRTESFLFLAALAINIACAWFTQTLGLSSLIGPILLGLMAVPRTGSLAQDLEAQLGPVTTTLLLPIFFALVGLKTDFTLLTTGDIGLAFVLLGALWGTTFVGAFAAACLVSREFTWHNLYFGTLLTCKGLTALTIFNILSAVGTITNRFYALVVLYAIISCAIVSPLIWFCQQIEARGKLARRRADPNFKEELRIFVLPRAGYLAPACATVAAWIAQHFDLPDAHILFARFLDDFDAIEQFIPLLQKPIPAPILANDGIFGPAQVRWNGMHPPGVTTYKAAVAPNLQEAYLRLASGDKSTNFHPYDFQIVGYDHTEGCWNIVQAAVQKQRARVFVVAGKPLMTLAGAHNALVLRNPAVGNSLFLTSLFQAQASTMSLTYWQPNDEFGRPIELMECTTPLQVLQTIAALDTPPASITAVFCPIPRSREEFRNLLNAANECHIPVVFESSAELPLQFSTASLGAMRTPLPRDDDDNDGDDGDNNDGSSEEPEGTPHRADRVVIVDGTDEV